MVSLLKDKVASVSVWTFAGHHTHKIPDDGILRAVDLEDVIINRAKLEVAADRLGRVLPRTMQAPQDRMTMLLLTRDFKIADECKTMVAVGTIKEKAIFSKSVMVDGGTGMTCQMFADKFANQTTPFALSVKIPLYVLDSANWYQCCCKGIRFGWNKLEHPPDISSFSGQCAFIGSRKMTDSDVFDMQEFCEMKQHSTRDDQPEM